MHGFGRFLAQFSSGWYICPLLANMEKSYANIYSGHDVLELLKWIWHGFDFRLNSLSQSIYFTWHYTLRNVAEWKWKSRALVVTKLKKEGRKKERRTKLLALLLPLSFLGIHFLDLVEDQPKVVHVHHLARIVHPLIGSRSTMWPNSFLVQQTKGKMDECNSKLT